MSYAYPPEILDTLAGHGLRPTAETPPSFVREALSDLYRYEIRRLRRSLLDGHIERAHYADHVIALRQRYWLLSLPVMHWAVTTEDDGGRSTEGG